MGLKKYNILEAVDRGIKLALDDYMDDGIDTNSNVPNSEVIENDDVIFSIITETVHRGIKLALDDYEDNINTTPFTQTNDIIDVKDEIRKRIYDVVDMGLPSGTLWARFNVGAKPIMKQTDENWYDVPQSWYGDYFAFGEITSKEKYNFDTYKFGINRKAYKHDDYLSKYYEVFKSPNKLDLCDDAAYMNSNGLFIMPTKEQYKELLKYSIITHVQHYNNIGGLYGRLFTSKINGKQLFFPEAGIKSDRNNDEAPGRSITYENIYNNINICYYWTASLQSGGTDTYGTQALYICTDNCGDDDMFVTSLDRTIGLPIRGVLRKK